MNYSLQFLGTGDAFGSGGRNQTSLFFKTPYFNMLIDCGATTAIALQTNHISTNEIDFIILTHFHGDHYGGVPFLLLEAAKIQKRTKPLRVLGPPGTREKLAALVSLLYPGSESVMDEIPMEFYNFSGKDELKTDYFQLKTYPVAHIDQTAPHGIKIILPEKTLAYSGDTGYTELLAELADKADLFICECNFFEHNSERHLNYQTIKANYRNWNCSQLILTHFGKEMLANLDKVELMKAEDDMIIYF